jgi:hypothetical protein
MPTPTPARIYNFIGKDNIPFHTIIWPGMLIGYNAGDHASEPALRRARQRVSEPGRAKFSTSRGNVIGFNTIWQEFQPDAMALCADGRGARDGRRRVHLADFMDRVNNELVANWGNLVNRMLGFAYKRFDGRAPTRARSARRRGLPRRDPRRVRGRGRSTTLSSSRRPCRRRAASRSASTSISTSALPGRRSARTRRRRRAPSTWRCRPSTGSA